MMLRRYFRFSLRTLLLAVLLVGSSSFLYHTWDPYYPALTLHGHVADVIACAVSSDGALAATGSLDDSVVIQETETGKVVRRIDCGDDVYFVAFTPDNAVVCASMNGSVFIASIRDNSAPSIIPHCNGLAIPAVSPDGKSLAIFKREGISIVDYPTLSQRTFCQDSAGQCIAMFSADSTQLITGADSQMELRVYDISTGLLVHKIPKLSTPSSVAPGRLAALDRLGVAHIFDTRTWAETATIGTGQYRPDGQIARLLFVRRGESCLGLAWDGHMSCWNSADGTKVGRLIPGAIPERCFASSADGATVLTGGKDGLARLWKRRRALGYVGILELPLCWLTVSLGVLALWSVYQDGRHGAVVSSHAVDGPTQEPASTTGNVQ